MSNTVRLNYTNLSIIQTIAISITAISVFDMGYGEIVNRGIWFNHVLFYLPNRPDFLQDNPFWGEFQLWAYCFFIVAICQFLKAIPPGSRYYLKLARNVGRAGVAILVGFPTLAVLLNIRKYDFQEQTLSSLIDYGWLSTVLMSWGLMLGSLLLIPYLLILVLPRNPQYLMVLATTIGLFGLISLFLIGVTLPTDEPYNHGKFVFPYWYAMMGYIFLTSLYFRVKEEPRNNHLFVLGLVISFGMLVLLIINELIDLPGFVQLILGVSVQVWHLQLINKIYTVDNNSS
ncbi:MAG: hypothetical protein ACXAD7_17840 [Candidatus Kariarchaeaceae archaeon]